MARINPSRGFTLIELLVVVAIIGLFSSVVLASLNMTQAKARDAARKADIHTIMVAISLYRVKYGSYPAIAYNTTSCGTKLSGTDALSTALKNDGDLRVMPSVPSNSGTCGDSFYGGTWVSPQTGQHIAILTVLENVDLKCTTWPGNQGWYTSGSYCNKYYIQVQ